MRWHLFFVFIVGFSLLFLLTEETCRAAFSLKPGIYMRLERTDNLFLAEDDRIREWIATIAPNLQIEQLGKQFNLKLEYSYEMYRFLYEPTLNNKADTHLGVLDGTIFPERAFRVELHGDATRESIDRRRSDLVDTPAVNTTNRYMGRIRPVYHLELGSRHFVETAYVYETVQYDTATSDDTSSHRGDLLLERKQSARLDLRLEGFYEQLTADINQDYDRQQAMVGGEWRPFTSTTLSAMAGVTWFEYESGENFNTRVYDCLLRYAPVQRWAIDASYLKNFDYDIEDGLYRTWQGAAGISYSGRLSWRLGLLVRIDEYVEIDRDDREQGAVGELTFKLTPKVILGLNGDGRRYEFKPETEQVDRYGIGASVLFKPREYIETGCRYSHRNSDSDRDLNDYRENRVFCDLRLTYDMIQ